MDDRYGSIPYPLPGGVPYFYSPGPSNTQSALAPAPTPTPAPTSNQVYQLPSGDRPDVVTATYQDLVRRMKVPDDKKGRHPRFIIREDLDAVYADPRRIAALIQPDCRNVDLDIVRNDMRLIISILVLIGARQCLREFQHCLYRRFTADLTDNDLPITMTSKLWFLPTEMQDHFMREQYAVLTFKIKEGYEPTTLRYDAQHRLPFERVEEKIGVGGYGKVDKIWIPPGYLEDRNGRYHTVVACKRFKVENEFVKEAGNIEMLKARLTTHTNIMLHLVTIARDETRFILLPFAACYDLSIFLRYGFDEFNKKVYDFQGVFPSVRKVGVRDAQQVTISLLQQSYGIAHALQWLHYEVSGANTTDRLFCMHMDLKPANILIDNPVTPSTIVGVWKISDFGISVFREQSNQQDSKFVSPLDYFEQLTAKTRPKRVPGSYTAPEVNGSEATVGRRGDVWSFSCMFTEVILFALGRHTLVQEFRDVRRSQMSNDHFYMAQTAQHLAAPGTAEQYQLKSTMAGWLHDLPNRFPEQADWLPCCVTTIFEMLVVDPGKRPLSTELVKLVDHLWAHCNATRTGQTIPCRLSSARVLRRESSSLVTPRPPLQSEPADHSASAGPVDLEQQSQRRTSVAQPPPLTTTVPSIHRVSTMSRETLHQSSSHVQTPVVSPISSTPSLQSPIFSASQRTRGSQTNSSRSSRPSISTVLTPPLGPGIKVHSASAVKPPAYRHWRLKVASGHKMVDMDKAEDVSISPNGDLIAYLVKSTVFIFKFDERWDSTSALQPIYLAVDVQWKHLAVSGNYIVVWGITKGGQKQVMFGRLSDRKLINGPPHSEITALKAVQIADSGGVALMCTHSIVYTSVEFYEAAGYSQSLPIHATQTYGSVAFNNTGSSLHAWIFGPHCDALKTWRIRDGYLVLDRPSLQEFPRSQSAEGARLFPFSEYPSVVIEAPATQFFNSSNFKADRRSSTSTVAHVHAARVFRDYSFITLEASTKLNHGRLREYAISHSGGKSLGTGAQQLETVKHIKPMNDGPIDMFVAELPSTDSQSKVMIIVTSAKGDIETLQYG